MRLSTFYQKRKPYPYGNPGHKNLTHFQKQYIEFFRSLKGLYNRFNINLKNNHQAYKGMGYRYVADNIRELKDNIPWEKIIFAGFNAFSRAEDIFVRELVKDKKADVLWDADEYYIDNPEQEAGDFIRHFIASNQDDNNLWINSFLEKNPRKIDILGTSSITAQATVAGNILKEWSIENKSHDGTAVILADEKLLLPVLNSIPDEYKSFNVTMGYPLVYTPLYSFYNKWLKIIGGMSEADSDISGNKKHIYKNDVLELFRHPYFKVLQKEQAEEIIQVLLSTNQFYFSLDDLKELFPADYSIFTKIFQTPEKVSGLIKGIMDITDVLRQKFTENQEDEANKYEVDIEYLFQFAKLVNVINEFIDHRNEYINIKSFRAILDKMLRNVSIPFYGEPLQGLQIMGVLESRVLDFKNIIILAMNEGIFPNAKHQQNSFIPFEIKKEFGLPGYKEKNSIYAYHFYRLLQRSENVAITYCTEPDLIAGGGKSRFIEQIITEIPEKCFATEIRQKLFTFALDKIAPSRHIEIKKDDKTVKTLRNLAQKGFSPSSLSTYIRCPLQFYFKHIVGLREQDENMESIDAAMLGTLVHESLYTLHKPLEGVRLTENQIEFMDEQIHQSLTQAIDKHYKKGNLDFGRNLLIYNVAKNLVKNFVRYQKRYIQTNNSNNNETQLLSLEKKFQHQLKFRTGMEEFNVTITGKIDRVEMVGKTINILDYKTGTVNQPDLKINDWEKAKNDPRYDKALQLLIYAWLYQKVTNSDHELHAGLLPLRTLKNGATKLKISDSFKIGPETISKTENTITQVLENIFNTSVPFFQTKDQKHCEFCFFKDICMR